MGDNIFEKLTAEEQTQLWMYMIFNRDKIIEKMDEWTKEAEKRGMTLTEYLESIGPRDMAMRNDILTKRFGIPMEKENKEELPIWLGKNCKDCGNEKCKKLGTLRQSESEGKE